MINALGLPLYWTLHVQCFCQDATACFRSRDTARLTMLTFRSTSTGYCQFSKFCFKMFVPSCFCRPVCLPCARNVIFLPRLFCHHFLGRTTMAMVRHCAFSTDPYKIGNGPFCSSVLSLPAAKVPRRELSLPGVKTRGTFAPASFRSKEFSFPRAKMIRELLLPHISRSPLKRRTFSTSQR